MDFDWDPEEQENGNTAKISERFEPEEVEYVLSLADPLVLTKRETVDARLGPETRFRVVGEDALGDLMTVVYCRRKGKIRPLSAFPTTDDWEVSIYRRGHPPAPLP